MDYRALVQKTTSLVGQTTTTLVGRLTTKMGSKDVGDEVVVETPSKTLGLCELKEKLSGLLTREGSSGEIGWALASVDGAPVQDETELFYSVWDELKNAQLGSSTEEMRAHSYLLVPGLFCNSYPTYFREILAYFKDIGLECEFAHINTEGAVKSNATAVKDIIAAQYEQFGKKVVLLGHSKGGTDAAAACAMYWTELKDKVRGLIMLQSPYGGTPLAADLLKEGQFGALNSIFLGKLASFSNPDGTVDAVKDLTYKNRRAFLEEYPLPSDVPTLCFHSNFPPDSITRFKKYMLKENLVAHSNFLSGRVELPLEMMLGKQLALMSRYILSRYPGVESDGMVTRKDAEVPGSVVVKFREELAHTLVIPEVFPAVQKPDEPTPPFLNSSLVCQACIMVLLTTR
ncbi:hypothetical protein M758_10G028400 [Ceratodon purpureus]|nr:hypothetical protein M758_10G028400 [Ceratodon purpureus]